MESEENKNQKTDNETSQLKAVGIFIWDLVKILVIALVIIIPFRYYIAEPFVVSGSSMLQNFHNRDYLIIDRISYRNNLPQRGDVIVLKYPKDPSQFFIKRIIGLPGESVKIQGGHVVIFNQAHPEGEVLSEPYLTSQTETLGRSDTVKLGSNEYYVLGDNRTGSSDSRVWGILPGNNIVGRVWVRVYPNSGTIPRPQYNF